jgi:fructose-bisphosphate aldolase, class II
MLASVKNILQEAQDNGYAVGAFNVFNMEETQAVVRAAVKKKSSVIVQVTEKTFDYAGDGVIADVVRAIIERESGNIPVGFHLDHGHSFDSVVRAVEYGLKSVMIDASRNELHDNIAITKRVVDYAHPKDVAVQAEIGKVAYLTEMEQNPNWDELMTDPQEAKQLVDETKVDALAVCIGNTHGFSKEREIPDWVRLSEIQKLIPDTFLVMHGASDWGREKVQEAVKRKVVCFNVDTDIRIAFNRVVCKLSSDRCSFVDPRDLLGEAREAVQKVVEEKVELFRRP